MQRINYFILIVGLIFAFSACKKTTDRPAPPSTGVASYSFAHRIATKDCPKNLTGKYEKGTGDLISSLELEILSVEGDATALKLKVSSMGAFIINGKLRPNDEKAGLMPYIEKYRAFCTRESVVIETYDKGSDTQTQTMIFTFDPGSQNLSIQYIANPANSIIDRTDIWSRNESN